MKIKRKPPDYERARAIRGSYYITQNGDQLIARGWPKKPKNPNTAYKKYRQAEFAYAAHFAASPEPIGYITAMAWAKETLMMPRDVLVSAAYGNLIDFVLPDGSEMEKRTVVAPNPQLMLDMVTDQPGALVARGPDMWEGLLPGSANYVLTMVDGLPDWRPSQGGGGGVAYVVTSSRTGNEPNNNATKGQLIIADQDLHVTGVSVPISASTGTSYKLFIAHLTSLVVDQVIYDGPVQSYPSGQYDQLRLPDADAFDIVAGEQYFIGATITSGTGSTSAVVMTSTGPVLGWPLASNSHQIAYVSNNAPTIGTTFLLRGLFSGTLYFTATAAPSA